MSFKSKLISIFWILQYLQQVSSYYILVDAHGEECFFEHLTSGTKLLFTFEVIEGGFLDIDVQVRIARIC